MSFVVCRIRKLKSMGGVSVAAGHVARTRPCPDADASRTPLNRVLVGSADPLGDVQGTIDANVDGNIRKNAVPAVEMILTASPEWFEGHPVEQFTDAAMEALQERYGPRLANVTLHLDEDTPHLHVLLVPFVKNTKGVTNLNCREMFGNRAKLRELQDWAGAWGSRIGLERGKAKVLDRDAEPEVYVSPRQHKRALEQALAETERIRQQAAFEARAAALKEEEAEKHRNEAKAVLETSREAAAALIAGADAYGRGEIVKPSDDGADLVYRHTLAADRKREIQDAIRPAFSQVLAFVTRIHQAIVKRLAPIEEAINQKLEEVEARQAALDLREEMIAEAEIATAGKVDFAQGLADQVREAIVRLGWKPEHLKQHMDPIEKPIKEHHRRFSPH